MGLRSPKRSLGRAQACRRVRTLLALPSRHSSCGSQMQNIQKMLRIQMLAWWGTDPITPRAQGGAGPRMALLENTLQTEREPQTTSTARFALTPGCPC